LDDSKQKGGLATSGKVRLLTKGMQKEELKCFGKVAASKVVRGKMNPRRKRAEKKSSKASERAWAGDRKADRKKRPGSLLGRRVKRLDADYVWGRVLNSRTRVPAETQCHRKQIIAARCGTYKEERRRNRDHLPAPEIKKP